MADPITRDRLEAELGNDPLFDAVQRLQLIEELFDRDTLATLVDRHEYTTTDFERWFCVSEADPRYLSTAGIMRAFVKELGTYLQTRNIGRTTILDYQGVLKLKMALLLRKQGMKPALIYETAGVKAYNAPIVHRPMNPSYVETPNSPQTQKGLLYDQVMESLITQLTAAGAVRQGQDGKIHVDLTTLIEKHLESMAQSLLPVGFDQTQEKLDELGDEVTRLKELGEKDREVVEVIKRSVESEVSEIKGTLELEAKEKIRSKNLESDCRAKADGIYQKIKSAEEVSKAEEHVSQLRKMGEEYPDFLYIIRDYENKADVVIVQLRLAEKQQREEKIKEECLQLFNITTDPKASKADIEKAKDQLLKIQEDNRDIAFDIRQFITKALSGERNKEKSSGGFFSRIFKTAKD